MTHKQGQYLTFIHYYTKLHRRPPSEADMREFFGTTPPTIHQMILTLERNGYLSRIHGQARSIQLLIDRDKLPELES